MSRDFLGVVLYVFVTVIGALFRTFGYTPAPTSPPIDIVGALVLLGLALIAVVWLLVWTTVVGLQVVLSGQWRYLECDRLLLASLLGLAWLVYDHFAPVRSYMPPGTPVMALPEAFQAALFVWGLGTNFVIEYWLVGAIRRLSRSS